MVCFAIESDVLGLAQVNVEANLRICPPYSISLWLIDRHTTPTEYSQQT